MKSLLEKSAIELSAGLKKKEFSAKELTSACLEQITKTKELNAYITVDEQNALTQAEEADRLLKNNSTLPLLGLPVALKDVILTKNMLTTCASKMLYNFIPPYDAHVSEKLKAAGAIIIGKTNLDEFCMGSSGEHSYYGATKNPWDPSRVPGGTSSGSAAAVASATVPWALGSDTGGSLRQPASYCGLIGVKPTYGRVSRYGVIAYASSLDQIGCVAHNTKDASLLLASISGHDKRDATSVKKEIWDPSLKKDLPKKLRIAIPKEYFHTAGLNPEVKEKIQACIDFFEKSGHECVEVSLPNTEYALAVYYIIAPAEASSNLSRYDGIRYGYRSQDCKTLEDLYLNSRSEGFGMEVKRRILIGTYVLSSGYYDAYYRKAQKVRALIRQDFSDVFDQAGAACDVILAPTAPTTAFKIGACDLDPVQMYLNDIFTIPASLAGLPALSFPCGLDQQGLPIGCQLIGNYWQEELLLKMVETYEQEINWQKLPKNILTAGN
jgi:aspartyl-tRNA(Asn)/glutamyl-tRNA(Gln) amidotransferase subunit A